VIAKLKKSLFRFRILFRNNFWIVKNNVFDPPSTLLPLRTPILNLIIKFFFKFLQTRFFHICDAIVVERPLKMIVFILSFLLITLPEPLFKPADVFVENDGYESQENMKNEFVYFRFLKVKVLKKSVYLVLND